MQEFHSGSAFGEVASDFSIPFGTFSVDQPVHQRRSFFDRQRLDRTLDFCEAYDLILTSKQE